MSLALKRFLTTADPFRQPSNPGLGPADALDIIHDFITTSQIAIRIISYFLDRSVDTIYSTGRALASHARSSVSSGFIQAQLDTRFGEGEAIDAEVERASAFCGRRHQRTHAGDS